MSVSDQILGIYFLRDRINELENAIRKHRDQKGDDRCWLDDIELYKILPEGLSDSDQRLHCPEEMLENCKKYIASRQPEGQAYISPQREIEKLNEIEEVCRTTSYGIDVCPVILQIIGRK